ncbi:hypothetical protein MMC07_003689 [Pseudocyphellaria aurata]|nr:hypothetical protein [Pseudocyphellaria aurata]
MSLRSPSSYHAFGFMRSRGFERDNDIPEFDVSSYRSNLRDLALRLESQEMKLCDLCKAISVEKMKDAIVTDKSGRKVKGYAHHASWIDLKNSGNRGCRLCFILYNISIVAAGSEKCLAASFDSVEDSYIQLYLNPVDRGVILLSCGEAPWTGQLGLCIAQGSSSTCKPSDLMWSVELDSSSPASFRKVNRWLQGCEQNHEDCHVPGNPPLPTRVIHVEYCAGLQHPHLHASKRQFGRYIALSHVWGKIGTLTTTTNNITERMQGIVLSEMPKSFRDAVTVTRRLGIKYLWIDSLCILQDSATDWENESAKMGEVYKNSALTISASSAINSHVGFLIARNPLEQLTCDLQHLASDGRNAERIQVVWPEPVNGDNRISTRGWTLQELILSPRVLHYTVSRDGINGQMVWQCQTQSEAENGSVTSIFGVLSQKIKHILKLVAEGSRSVTAIYKCWYYIARQYSHRRLSYASDKLPALSGLASEFWKYTGDSYLAGLWKGDMAGGLLWAASTMEKLQRTTEYRAPSWSWASIEGEIYYEGILAWETGDSGAPQKYELEVLDAQTTIAGLNPFGAVDGGHMKVRGLLKATPFSHVVSSLDRSYPICPFDSEISVGRARFDEGDPPSDELVWLLLVSKEGHFHWQWQFQTKPNGLVLLPTSHELEFSRVGIFELHKGFMDWLNDDENTRVITII